MRRPWIALLGLAVLAGCRPIPLAPNSIEVVRDEDHMKTTLLQRLPLGTPVEKARKIMEQQGFSCSVEKNSSFTAQLVKHSPIDFLYCVRNDHRDRTGIIYRWGVAVVTDRGMVIDILVTCMPTNPWQRPSDIPDIDPPPPTPPR